MRSTKNLSSASSSTTALVRRPLCFFKAYNRDRSSQQLKLPSEFVKKLSYVTPWKSVLLCCGQRIWSVGVVEVENTLLFKNGWIDFVNDTFLESGDFLVFSYSGGKKFIVQIYGQNTCEKNYAFLRENRIKRGDDKTVQYGEDVNNPGNDDYEDQSEDSESCEELAYGEKFCDYSSSSRGKQIKKYEKKKCTEDKQRPGVGDKVKNRIWNRAGIRNSVQDVPYETKLPHFKVIMVPSYISNGQLNIPLPFAAEYMEVGTRRIVLKTLDKSWHVTLTKYAQGCCKISGGWLAFVRFNFIKLGDLCVFELIDKENFTLKVSILKSPCVRS